jgi:hypothetical protein
MAQAIASNTQVAPVKAAKTFVTASGKLTDRPQVPATLRALQFLVTAGTNVTDAQVFAQLGAAFAEAKATDTVLLLERIMLHVGDVSRQHNILRELGINSDKGGAQQRVVFRAILRWWAANLPESFAKNLRVLVEFTNYENLFFYQNTTDRKKGNLLKTEVLLPMPGAVQQFIASQISQGRDLNLIAKHLPKPVTGQLKTTKKVVKAHKGNTQVSLASLKLKADVVRVNGERVGKDATVNAGDVVTYSRRKQAFTIEKQHQLNAWIASFCDVMGWTLEQYRAFRSQQNTPEQRFASKRVADMPKSEFTKLLDTLTNGQRNRVARMIAYKDDKDVLHPQPKWGNLGAWYIEWQGNQSKVADKLRVLATQELTRDASTEKKQLMAQVKVKTTGVTTVDLLAEMYKGRQTDDQINTTYQAMIERMDLIANVFVVADGSGSMDGADIEVSGVRLSRRQVAYALTVAFSTRNPVAAFRNTFGWFSNSFRIIGKSNLVDDRPNSFVARAAFQRQVNTYNVLSEGDTFTRNLANIRAADPGEYAHTNPMSVVQYFVDLLDRGVVQVEDLPQALLYISDNEFNTGMPVKQAMELAAQRGWRPLQIFWGIVQMPPHVEKQLKDVPNTLFVGGFNESRLSQVLRGIKSGSVDPEDELWSLYENPRYSVLK